MSLAEVQTHRASGSFNGGMLPKIDAVCMALGSGAKRAVIAGGERALHKALNGDGTIIVP